MNIRSMTLEDIPAIISLGNGSPELGVSEQSKFWSKERLASWVQAGQDVNLVVENDGIVVGFQLTQLHLASQVGYLSDMVVSPAYRRQGIGSALAEATLKAMSEKGITYVYALTQENNTAIKQLLIKSGFQLGETMKWFEKRISA